MRNYERKIERYGERNSERITMETVRKWTRGKC